MHRIRRTSAAFALATLCGGAAEAAEPPALDDVVVTARRRTETVSEVPLAVRAIDRTRMDRLGPTQLSDLGASAPGFAVERAGGVDTVYIRGAGGGGRNIGFGARTAVYLDGVYIGQPGALNRSLADAERIEILRGPQGALFGRNTVSGAVEIVSRSPGPLFSAEARGWLSSFDARGAYGAVNLPLAAGKVSARVSGLRERRGDYAQNLFDRSGAGGALDLASARASILYTPTAALSFELALDHALDRSTRAPLESVSSPTGAGASDPFAPGVFDINENVARIRTQEQNGVALTTNWSLAGGAKATSITALRTTRAHRRSDNDYSPLDILSTDYQDRFVQASQELRIASPSEGRLGYVAGIFALHESARSTRRALLGRDTLRAGLNAPPGGVIPARSRIGSDSLAAFATVDYRLAPGLTASAGLRVNHDREVLLFDLDGRTSGVLQIASLTGFRDRQSETRAIPTASLIWKPAANISVYGRYAEGFKAGGWNVDFLNTRQTAPLAGSSRRPFAFAPENVRSVEGGLKATAFERRLRFDVTAFSMAFGDYQVNRFLPTAAGTSVLQLTNAAKAKSQGVELSADLAPSRALRLGVDLAWTDARFKAFPGGGANGADATGARLPFSPKTMAGVEVEVLPPLPARLGEVGLTARVRHRGAMFAGQENTSDQRLAASTTLDGELAWRLGGGGLGLRLYGRNLLDQTVPTNVIRDFLGTRTLARAEPRTWGVELQARF